MTIVIGLVNNDGIVMLSDRKWEFSSGKHKRIGYYNKLFYIPEIPISIGLAGEFDTKKISSFLRSHKEEISDSDYFIRSILKNLKLDDYASLESKSADFLLGISGDSNRLYYGLHDGTLQSRERYSCIGAGSQDARIVIQSNMYHPSIPLEDAVKMGFEALDFSIKQNKRTCGGKDAIVVTPDGITRYR